MDEKKINIGVIPVNSLMEQKYDVEQMQALKDYRSAVAERDFLIRRFDSRIKDVIAETGYSENDIQKYIENFLKNDGSHTGKLDKLHNSTKETLHLIVEASGKLEDRIKSSTIKYLENAPRVDSNLIKFVKSGKLLLDPLEIERKYGGANKYVVENGYILYNKDTKTPLLNPDYLKTISVENYNQSNFKIKPDKNRFKDNAFDFSLNPEELRRKGLSYHIEEKEQKRIQKLKEDYEAANKQKIKEIQEKFDYSGTSKVLMKEIFDIYGKNLETISQKQDKRIDDELDESINKFGNDFSTFYDYKTSQTSQPMLKSKHGMPITKNQLDLERIAKENSRKKLYEQKKELEFQNSSNLDVISTVGPILKNLELEDLKGKFGVIGTPEDFMTFLNKFAKDNNIALQNPMVIDDLYNANPEMVNVLKTLMDKNITSLQDEIKFNAQSRKNGNNSAIKWTSGSEQATKEKLQYFEKMSNFMLGPYLKAKKFVAEYPEQKKQIVEEIQNVNKEISQDDDRLLEEFGSTGLIGKFKNARDQAIKNKNSDEALLQYLDKDELALKKYLERINKFDQVANYEPEKFKQIIDSYQNLQQTGGAVKRLSDPKGITNEEKQFIESFFEDEYKDATNNPNAYDLSNYTKYKLNNSETKREELWKLLSENKLENLLFNKPELNKKIIKRLQLAHPDIEFNNMEDVSNYIASNLATEDRQHIYEDYLQNSDVDITNADLAREILPKNHANLGLNQKQNLDDTMINNKNFAIPGANLDYDTEEERQNHNQIYQQSMNNIQNSFLNNKIKIQKSGQMDAVDAPSINLDSRLHKSALSNQNHKKLSQKKKIEKELSVLDAKINAFEPPSESDANTPFNKIRTSFHNKHIETKKKLEDQLRVLKEELTDAVTSGQAQRGNIFESSANDYLKETKDATFVNSPSNLETKQSHFKDLEMYRNIALKELKKQRENIKNEMQASDEALAKEPYKNYSSADDTFRRRRIENEQRLGLVENSIRAINDSYINRRKDYARRNLNSEDVYEPFTEFGHQHYNKTLDFLDQELTGKEKTFEKIKNFLPETFKNDYSKTIEAIKNEIKGPTTAKVLSGNYNFQQRKADPAAIIESVNSAKYLAPGGQNPGVSGEDFYKNLDEQPNWPSSKNKSKTGFR